MENTWIPDFDAKPLPSGKFAPLVRLSRSAGEGPRESSLTYEGEYATKEAAVNAARQHYGGQRLER